MKSAQLLKTLAMKQNASFRARRKMMKFRSRENARKKEEESLGLILPLFFFCKIKKSDPIFRHNDASSGYYL